MTNKPVNFDEFDFDCPSDMASDSADEDWSMRKYIGGNFSHMILKLHVILYLNYFSPWLKVNFHEIVCLNCWK